MRYKQIRSVLLTLVICLCTAVLVGCALVKPEETTAPATEPTLPTYSVRFVVDGEVYKEQQIKEGSTPSEVIPQKTGMRFAGWLDESGDRVTPQAAAVEADTVYYAEVYPMLGNHVPYLFADASGFLRPDDDLTADEMTAAIQALAVSGAESYLPELPAGTDALTTAQAEELLKKLFPAEETDAAMQAAAGETFTRADLAIVMNTLLERGLESGLTLSAKAVWPLDLSASHAACSDLMEACFAHTHTAADLAWLDQAAQLQPVPGFMNIDGWLYYVGEDSMAVRNTQIGELAFGPDGRYTSGDAELDSIVAEILKQIIANEPEAERIDLLRRAHEYSRDSFTYLRRSAYEFGATGWEVEDAKRMFTTKLGNCYNFAASFWALARGLGYEAVGVSGTMTRTDQPHGWVEIVLDGTPYIFDPEMEYVYYYEREVYDKDMFMVTYLAGNWWNYKRPAGLHD